MKMRVVLGGFTAIICLHLARCVPTGPVLRTVEIGRVIHGMISEDALEGTEVELDQPLLAGKTHDNVCGYTVYKSGAVSVPFQVVLNDHDKTQGAKIVLAKGQKLNYEMMSKYEFDISATDCLTGAHSQIRDSVEIQVKDVNDFAPVWREQTHTVEVVEGVLYKRLLKLEAFDGDGSDIFSKICHYNLLSTDVPFTINEQGYLQNKEPLDYSVKRNYILEVEAEDCGHKTSEKLLVNIIVKPECKIGWQGMKSNLVYVPHSEREMIADNASLELCGATCELNQLTVTTKLTSQKGYAGCPLDVKSIASRNEQCGSADEAVSLLPDSVSETTNNGFTFDGKSIAYDVPLNKFSGALAERFSLSTWIKHQRQGAEVEEIKQHILCNADEEGMNRHHYSLFLHNCRLILLLRQEPTLETTANVIKPAEWRWKLPEVCDGNWHHYTVSMDFPQVRLYVDGQLFVATKHNPSIVDDWPLHISRKAKGSRLVVGACWEGGDGHFGQHLIGQLAGLTLVNNETADDRMVQCINDCRERLDFHAISEMDSGMSISMNSEMSRLSINGKTIESVEKLLNRIGYLNSRGTVTQTENAKITVETTIKCADGSSLSVPASNLVINIMQHKPTPTPTTLTLVGSTHVEHDEQDIKLGQRLFTDIHMFDTPVMATTAAESDSSDESDEIPDKQMEDARGKHELSSCLIHVEPQLVVDVERLHYPIELTQKLNVKVDSGSSGLAFNGPARMVDYVDILRDVLYEHKSAEELMTRNFTLTCTQSNGQSMSNELVVELSVIHKAVQVAEVVNRALVDNHVLSEVSDYKIKELKVPAPVSGLTDNSKQASGAGMAMIVIVCVGFLLLIMVVGVKRLRAAHQRTVDVNIDEKQEMEWDNSALTITVNPLDHQVFDEEAEPSDLHGEESDSDDEIGSFHDDAQEETSDEEADKEKEDKGLEWDSTTATY